MDKQGRLFGIINLFDLLVIAVVITAAVVLVPMLTGSLFSGSNYDKTIYFTLELPQTTQKFADKISIGDEIKDNTRGYYYGVVEKVETKPAKTVRPSVTTGEFVFTEVPDEVDVYVTVECKGTESDKEITAEGHPIQVGKSVVIKGKGYAASGYIIDLRVGGGE